MPPLVVGAVIAAGAAFAAGGLALAVSIGAAAMSFMAILTAKKPSFDSFRSPQERKQVLRAAAAPKNAVYGTIMGSGVLFFAEEEAGDQTEGEWLHMCLTVAGHPIDGIEGLLLNDEPIADYGGNVTWELHNNRTTADPFLLQHCPSWKEDMIGRGIAFLRISFKFDAEKFPSGIPNVKWVKRGWHVYDPRDSQTKFSSNAALVYLHYLRHYRKVTDADILWDHFIAAANISAEAVAIGSNQYENRYLINCEFDIEENPTKVMQAMLDACSGQAVYTGGKHGLLVGAYNGPAVHDIYEYQIIGDVQITPETSLADRCNTMTGKFVNKDDGYTECDFPKVTVQQYVTEDGREYVEDVNYRFVTSVYQAQRLAMMNLQRKRVGRTITIPMNFSAFAYRPGESVNLYMPSLGIAGVEHRIVKWDFSLRDAIGLVLVQDTPEIYGDIIGRPIVRPPLTTLPSSGPAMPDQLRFTTTPVGETIQGQLTWANYGVIAYNEVIVKRGTATVTTVQLPGQVCRLGGLAAGDYSAMVRAVALNGAPSPWATIAFTVAVPPVPNRVDTEVGNWNVSLFPKFTTSLAFGTICEFYYYRADLPINEVETTAQLLGMGTSLVHDGRQPDTIHYYWVRSVNAYGKSAFFALSVKTAYDVDSVLNVISGSIGAEDLIEELRNPLENTIDMWTAKVGNTDIAKYGGIGLTIEQDPDGVWRTKCIVDAEVFAILDPSGATGEGSRHPFVVKDGVVYMNKLLLDDAEIGQVIAKYIDVQHLVGTLIEGGSFRGGDLWIGENPNGQFGAHGKKWNAGIRNDGVIFGSDVYFTSGNYTGTVNANAGTFNNVIIQENCNVLGTVYANKIVGDVCKVLSFDNSGGSAAFPAFNRNRVMTNWQFKAVVAGMTLTPTHVFQFWIELRANGQKVSGAAVNLTAPSSGVISDQILEVPSAAYPIPSGAQVTLTLAWGIRKITSSGDINTGCQLISPVIAAAFIQ